MIIKFVLRKELSPKVTKVTKVGYLITYKVLSSYFFPFFWEGGGGVFGARRDLYRDKIGNEFSLRRVSKPYISLIRVRRMFLKPTAQARKYYFYKFYFLTTNFSLTIKRERPQYV